MSEIAIYEKEPHPLPDGPFNAVRIDDSLLFGTVPYVKEFTQPDKSIVGITESCG